MTAHHQTCADTVLLVLTQTSGIWDSIALNGYHRLDLNHFFFKFPNLINGTGKVKISRRPLSTARVKKFPGLIPVRGTILTLARSFVVPGSES